MQIAFRFFAVDSFQFDVTDGLDMSTMSWYHIAAGLFHREEGP